MATVLKLGGELLEDAAAVGAAASSIARLSARGPLVVVHGGGRAIDAELKSRGLTPRFADGLRITDPPTLESVVSVLAGRTNTALVAALGAAGVKAVGLTGADARIGLAVKAAPFATISGELVDLGQVGQPCTADVSLLTDLLRLGYVPAIASIGVAADGTLLNVNADTFAAHLAAAVRARRLIVAGTTAGVLDASGATLPEITEADVARMTASGTAHSGMVAKLAACRHALSGGVTDVSIVTGRGVSDFEAAQGTRVLLNSDPVWRD